MWFRDAAPLTYDSGNYPELLRRALELADYAEARREQAALRAQGRYRGIGVAICVEGVGLGPFEGAILRLDSRGRVVVTSGAPPQGQGYQTAFAQIAADAVGVRYEDVDVVTGDTGAIPYGVGSFASRVTANAGPAILAGRRRAAREDPRGRPRICWRPRAADLEIVDGAVRVRGLPGPRRAARPGRAARQCAASAFGMVMPGGLVGRARGLRVLHAVAGRLLGERPRLHPRRRPRDRRGHDRPLRRRPRLRQRDQPADRRGPDPGRRGPRALSNALYEEAIYDEQGQSLASSFLDYPLPSAREMPRVEMFHLTTPSPINPLGVKGAGEAGTLPVTAAVADAVEDALRPFGVRVNRMPLNPARISDLIHRA